MFTSTVLEDSILVSTVVEEKLIVSKLGALESLLPITEILEGIFSIVLWS